MFHSETECQSFQGSCPLDEEPSVADNTKDNTYVCEDENAERADEDSEQSHTDSSLGAKSQIRKLRCNLLPTS